MHLLAYPDDQNRCVQREAQATVMAQVVKPYIDKGYEVIVTGDLNDFDGELLDVNNNVPISQVLSILKAESSKYALTSVASFMPQDERYSIWWDSNYDCVYKLNETSMIDHILVTPGLLGKIESAYIAHGEYPMTCDSYYSDHWPVVVDFKF